eukprot:g2785.t1
MITVLDSTALATSHPVFKNSCWNFVMHKDCIRRRRKRRNRKSRVEAKSARESTPESTEISVNFPFVCNITYTASDRFVCGGILVDANFVATAAHCVDSIKPTNRKQALTVYCDDAKHVANVTEVVLHENWLQIARLPYDIALLRINVPATSPVANYTAKDLSIANGTLISVEWNKKKGGYYESSTSENVTFVNQTVCNGDSHWTRSIDDTVFCALPTGDKECSGEILPSTFALHSCSDVAGSALIMMPNATDNYTETYVFAGLASFGTQECDRHGFPIVYTSIFEYADWIESQIYDDTIPVPIEQQEMLEEQFVRNITDIYRGHNASVILEGALIAIAEDDYRTLEVFFTLGLDPDATYDEFERTLLHFAADNDAYHSASIIIGEGANVSAVSVFGTTPVHAAAVSGSVSVLTLLLRAGSYVNAVDEEYSTPLHHLMDDGNGTLVQLLTLLEGGANVHVEDSLDVTPLHYAARENWISAAKVLLQAGANLIVYAYDDGAPIHWAAAAGSVEVLTLLIDAGTNLEARPSSGLRETPLSYAVRNDGPLSTIQILLDNGAFPDVRDIASYTPLHRAAERGALDIIAALVEAGASVSKKNRDGDYPRDIFCKMFDCSLRRHRRTYKILKYN